MFKALRVSPYVTCFLASYLSVGVGAPLSGVLGGGGSEVRWSGFNEDRGGTFPGQWIDDAAGRKVGHGGFWSWEQGCLFHW